MTRRDFLVFSAALPWWWRKRHAGLAGIRFRIVQHGHSSHRYLHIHGDEQTARAVLLDFLPRHNGKAFLVESDTRTVSIRGGKLDPNRMFSRLGAEKSLRALNAEWPGTQIEAALGGLDRDREAFLKQVLPPDGGLLIAVHNNSRGYSVNDETAISDRVSLNDPDNPHDFCLATDPADFAVISQSPFNAVLQQKPGGEEDGSLSRLAASKGKRYVNIEAAAGNFEKQMAILEWLARELPEKRR